MPNLKTLKKRITSIESTQKITSAMKMVATANYRKAQQYWSEAKNYYDEISLLMHQATLIIGFHKFMPQVFQAPKTDKGLLIAFGESRGLCGSFSVKLFNAIQAHLSENTQTQTKILCAGERLKARCEKAYGKENVIGMPSPTLAAGVPFDILTQQILSAVRDEGINSVSMAYCSFQNVMAFEPKIQPLFPLNAQRFALSDVEKPKVFEMLPSPEAFLEAALERWIEAALKRAHVESQLSEHSARMMAMEGASKNADKLIQNLTLEYNRTRQAQITKELIEIISGAEAV